MLVDLREVINPVYHPYLWDTNRWLILFGGAGSGKSHFAAQKVLIRMMGETPHRFLVTRKVRRTIKDSCFALLCFYIHAWGVAHLWDINKSDFSFSYKPNGNRIICVGLDDPEKVKSVFDPTSMWHEEPTELMPGDLTQLNLRMRGEFPNYKQHILSFNPVTVRHWLKRRFFDEQVANCVRLKTTYKDNKFIDDEYKAELEALTGNDHEVYARGNWGSLRGAIYSPWPQPETWPTSFDEEIWGLDFGYNNPMALVRIGLRDQRSYLTEEVYARGLTTGDLISRMRQVMAAPTVPGGLKRDLIYADAAEPDRIEEIRRAGFNVRPARKGQGSVVAGINFVKNLEIFTRSGNENINAENDSYVWKEDAYGEPLDEPADDNNHAMDAIRYALYTHLSGKGATGAAGGWSVYDV